MLALFETEIAETYPTRCAHCLMSLAFIRSTASRKWILVEFRGAVSDPETHEPIPRYRRHRCPSGPLVAADEVARFIAQRAIQGS
jgi:hypothetical protein